MYVKVAISAFFYLSEIVVGLLIIYKEKSHTIENHLGDTCINLCTMKPPKIKGKLHGTYLINHDSPWYIH